MIEGNLPLTRGRKAASGEIEPLRELTWSDLVARLSAARDLRRALGATEDEHEEEGSPASFDADSARHISAHEIGQDLVNHNASAYRKTKPAERRSAQFKTRETR